MLKCAMSSTTCHWSVPMGRRSVTMLRSLTLLSVGVLIGIGLYKLDVIPDNISVTLHLDLPYGEQFNLSSRQATRVRSSLELRVPNIVHYIWLGKNREFSFLNYLSMLSAYNTQQPDMLLFHCDHLPRGPWWNMTQQRLHPQVLHFTPPDEIHGQKLVQPWHRSDVSRLLVLLRYGGIYLDGDVLVTRSVDPLRHYTMTLGREKADKLNAGIIIANRDALFLKLWYESYRDNYRHRNWDFNSARVPYELSLMVPDLLHVESYRLSTPDYRDRRMLRDQVINWQDLYVIHVMNHHNDIRLSPQSIRTMDSTIGEVARTIYYGHSKLLPK